MLRAQLLSALGAHVAAAAILVFLLAVLVRRLTALLEAMAGLILAWSRLRRLARRD